MPEFQFTTLLPTSADKTSYRLISKDHVKEINVDGESFLKVDPEEGKDRCKGEEPAVFIQDTQKGCWATVGRDMFGRNKLNLGTGCEQMGKSVCDETGGCIVEVRFRVQGCRLRGSGRLRGSHWS